MVGGVQRRSPLPVKVCCIQDEAELGLAIDAGARMVGLVSKMPSGWGPIADEVIAQLARQVPPGVVSVLLTSRTSPAAVIAQQRHCACNALQIVDAFPDEGFAELRAALPGVSLLKAVHVTDESAIERAVHLSTLADGLILDSGAPSGPVKVLGGTGLTHDWSISRRIVQSSHCPVFLAGGLKAENVAEAIRTVRPWGLDLCTGVRTHHRLDGDKLAAFFAAVAAGRGLRW